MGSHWKGRKKKKGERERKNKYRVTGEARTRTRALSLVNSDLSDHFTLNVRLLLRAYNCHGNQENAAWPHIALILTNQIAILCLCIAVNSPSLRAQPEDKDYNFQGNSVVTILNLT